MPEWRRAERPPLRCRLGLHAWTVWLDRGAFFIWATDPKTNEAITDVPIRTENVRERECLRCNDVEIKRTEIWS